jgi:hypothetical protein
MQLGWQHCEGKVNGPSRKQRDAIMTGFRLKAHMLQVQATVLLLWLLVCMLGMFCRMIVDFPVMKSN